MVFIEAATTAGWPSRPAIYPPPFLLFSVLINWLAHTHTLVYHMLLCKDGVIPSRSMQNRLQVSIYESLFLSAMPLIPFSLIHPIVYLVIDEQN
jgi:ABC-type protease/lipase transport system fused ATPase/permease subunit